MFAQPPTWRKSTHCGPNAGCVETARLAAYVGVRDGKQPGGPVLRVSPDGWRTLLTRIKTDVR
ncbi:protein of unknown function [Thermomonospora echinospora]|uniref:DUF397 domain-containing protein n=1 Tax=Thermomonospora echinospora TaxID=1992 RepID=A0A1H5ZAH3_9ACTN|nr:DUF397 domain-containing protein [Thermomonospora echinospora]SEG33533.1 protein of unknown function [Thermomonospora echinospora]